jgi:hypothetical protein
MTGFADVVAVVRQHLAANMPVPVATRVPDPRPSELVQIRRVGGVALQPIRESVRLDVFAWAGSEPRAQYLASE